MNRVLKGSGVPKAVLMIAMLFLMVFQSNGQPGIRLSGWLFKINIDRE
jgi:hypothetical protein